MDNSISNSTSSLHSQSSMYSTSSMYTHTIMKTSSEDLAARGPSKDPIPKILSKREYILKVNRRCHNNRSAVYAEI